MARERMAHQMEERGKHGKVRLACAIDRVYGLLVVDGEAEGAGLAWYW